jgi:Pvc16 N-terminal domain
VSNAQVIAATTATLRLMLLGGIPARDAAIAQVDVTTVPPDKVTANLDRPTLNLFLYQTVLNGAWRNRDAAHARPGEEPLPPLALNLHYLLTAYGQVDIDEGDFSHRVLGAAVSVLHDHPVLGADELVAALPQHKALPQVERLRISPLATSIEEMSKLWTIFQTNYRISTAYEVAVVLIESERRPSSPLPVLRRGEADQGPTVLASVAPTLIRAVAPGGRAAVRLGEPLTIEGRNIGAGQRLRVRGAHLAEPVMLDPLPGGTSDRISVALPAAGDAGAMTTWAPGFYTAAVVRPYADDRFLSSNSVAFALAPSITVAPTVTPAGPATLTVRCSPRIRDDQAAVLLFGTPPVAVAERPRIPTLAPQPTACTFDVTGVAGKEYVVRLRVDGVDSVPIEPAKPGSFDPAQTVTFT